MESEKKTMFVGGLLRKTTDDSLREHCSKYGTVDSSSACRDWISGNSRGFDFDSCSEASSAKDALQETHVIVGRKVEVNEAISEGERHTRHDVGLNTNNIDAGSNNNPFRNKKIFVGGLAPNVTGEELKKYFEEFGAITDAVVIHDRATNISRGFGFITFDSEESFEKVMQSRFYYLGGKPMEVKRAVPRDGNNNTSNGNGRWSSFNGYQHGSHPLYGYGFVIPPEFAPMPWYRGYGYGEYFNSADGYVGAYGGMVYRVPYIFPL